MAPVAASGSQPALLAWLTSADNTQMTGQILFAHGGFECRMLETEDKGS